MFKHILVPLDGSTLSEKALGIATAIARASKAKVTLMHSITINSYAYTIAPVGGEAYQQMMDADILKSTGYLNQLKQRLLDCGVSDVGTAVMTGTPGEAISDAAKHGCDLIVMSTHGRTGVARTMFGSIANDVVCSANVPVLLVSAHQQIAEVDGCAPAFQRILVPLDGSAFAEQVMPIAGAIARTNQASVLLLNVEQAPVYSAAYAADHTFTDNRDAKVDRYLNRAALSDLPAGVDYETMETSGEPGSAIARIATQRDCDLIVMSTHGRTGFDRLRFGSVADAVVTHTKVPVLLMRGLPLVDSN